MFSCGFCEISKSTFSYRTSPVAAPGYPKSIYAYWYLFKVVHGCIIYHHNMGYISMWLYQHQKMWKYHCSWKFTNKKRTLKFPQVLFLIISGSSTPFLITPTPGYCKLCQHFHSPRKFHILNPPMAAIIIKSSMYSYTTLYAIY